MKKGTGRTVVFFGCFALKFCRIKPLLDILKYLQEEELSELRWNSFLSNVKFGWYFFRRGIKQNLTEYDCWKKTKAPFLAPTYFSLGIMNIQKKEEGEQPALEKMVKIISAIAEKTGADFSEIYCVDPHCLQPDNFLKNENGYIIVDYGDSDNVFTFPQFIAKWQKEITAVLCRS